MQYYSQSSPQRSFLSFSPPSPTPPNILLFPSFISLLLRPHVSRLPEIYEAETVWDSSVCQCSHGLSDVFQQKSSISLAQLSSSAAPVPFPLATPALLAHQVVKEHFQGAITNVIPRLVFWY